MDDALQRLLTHLDRERPGRMRGAYLYGSAVSGGLRPDSDVDVLLLTERSLDERERASLTRLLLQISGWKGHVLALPEAAHRRPLELTSVVIDDDRRWPDPPVHDFQFGEWLRADIASGKQLRPAVDPDVPILLATAHHAHRVLRGPALDDVLAPVPAVVVRGAMLAIIPDILEEIVGDERNTLLALARIITTLRTDSIVPKDVAAAMTAADLRPAPRSLMEKARDGYLGRTRDDWSGLEDDVTALAHDLAREAKRLTGAA